jgi:DNA-binding CsgD family transcriptional regulator
MTMRKGLRGVLLTIAILIASSLQGQNTIGIPNIINYSKQTYGAGSQNWQLAQDHTGILYFANNDGLLTFDGASWRLYRLPNKTIARSVAIADDGRVYVGGQGEIGYFSPNKQGELAYTSLNNLVREHDFADVWNICIYQQRIFFRANKKILEYDGQRIVAHSSVNWGFMGKVNGMLLAIETNKGLMYYYKGQWLPRIKYGALPKENVMIRSAVSIGQDSVLLVSLMHGLYMLHHDTLTRFETPIIKEAASKNIFSAALLSNDRIALATALAGCIIINKKGQFIQRITKREGIQHNHVLAVLMDKDMNLWLGLDNGIDLVTYNNAIRHIFPDLDNRNSGYTSAVHKNQLYLGVSTGVFKTRLDTSIRDLSYTIGAFEMVQNSQGQVWNISTVNNKLFLGHNKGAFMIEGDKAVPLDTKTGFWGFQPLYANQPSTVIAAGTYNGISFYKYNNGTITAPVDYSGVESARFVAVGKELIWIAHPYKGVYSIRFDASGTGVAARYADRKNILSTNHNKIFKLKDRIILTTDKGIFEYDDTQKDFVHAVWLEKLTGHLPVSYLKEDAHGNIWFCRDRKLSVIDRSGGRAQVITIPEIDGRIMGGGFEHINVLDSNNVLIAAEKGFFHINYAAYRKTKQPLQVLIRKVQPTEADVALVFGGYGAAPAALPIPFKNNALHFECASLLYGQELNTEYSYFLEGFDQHWTAWTKKTERDFTNLPAGNYVFRVKCRNNPGNESPVSEFSFTILPPWYQTWWAFGLYLACFAGVLYVFYLYQKQKYKKLQQKKLQEQQRKYDEEQKQLQLQHQLEIQESEKQIIQLKNEKLQSEVAHKNTELASSAMNLVRKKEMLSKLKEDLAAYKTLGDAAKAAREFQKIVRVIDKELDHNEEWEQFAVHFDSVHTNYLKILKDKYPGLTTSDLKLAAYLRLSLSSKEIAQLLNISVRGVETSRYRLRKKLELEGDVNLYDFLIRVTSGEGEAVKKPQ